MLELLDHSLRPQSIVLLAKIRRLCDEDGENLQRFHCLIFTNREDPLLIFRCSRLSMSKTVYLSIVRLPIIVAQQKQRNYCKTATTIQNNNNNTKQQHDQL